VNGVDLNERGSFKTLIYFLTDALAKRYSAFELIWKKLPGGYTAEFRWWPLWFFENLTGRLRFRPSDSAYEGVDLEPGGWFVAVGDGLMAACSIAWMFKNLSLRDWVIYSQDYGKPGIQWKTNAAKDSPEWKAAVQGLMDYTSELRVVTSKEEEIVPID